jgi:hypothetical protein
MINPLASALSSLRPGADFSFVDQDISTIVWNTEGVTIPTETEIAEEIARLEAIEIINLKAKEDAKASAQAKLAALGLTSEEILALYN